ncbi:MAG: LLM class flavin-dependent oxidoreductase [Deltaproteobacteria bacterium]|nr:LLM class flavin-dependent oxidoreductase [Deltaproteobacteria bacterium]
MADNTGRVTVGYQDGCLHPLVVSKTGIRLARWMGAEAIWLPDHFMGFAPKWMWTPENVPAARVIHSMDALFDPVPVLTYVALKYRKLLIGTSVTEPIRRHPMSLAQTFVTLDHLSSGRAILGIGNGLRENTEPYGLDCDRRVARLEEALELIGLLWGSEGRPVQFEGKFWHLRDAVFDLPLYKKKPPRVFLGAHFPRMLKLCGRYGDGWLPGQKVPGQEYGARLDVIREAAAEAGRGMEGFVATQTLLCAFGDSRQQVIDLALGNKYCAYMALGLPPEMWKEHGAEHPLGPNSGGFLEIVPSRVTEEHVDAALAALTPDMLDYLFYMGSPREILDEAAPLAQAGCRHFIIANMGGVFTGRGIKDFPDMYRLMRGLRGLAVRG